MVCATMAARGTSLREASERRAHDIPQSAAVYCNMRRPAWMPTSHMHNLYRELSRGVSRCRARERDASIPVTDSEQVP